MTTLLLAVIYAAFISLGLPDALLGSAWPMMYSEFEVSISRAGVVFMIISAGAVASSLMSDKLTRRFGTGKVTAFSVGVTAAALLGFSCSTSFWMLCLWAVPYGLGGRKCRCISEQLCGSPLCQPPYELAALHVGDWSQRWPLYHGRNSYDGSAVEYGLPHHRPAADHPDRSAVPIFASVEKKDR